MKIAPHTITWFVVSALILVGCAHKGAGAYGQGQAGFGGMPVSAQPLRLGSIASTFAVTSTVMPLQQASLSSVVSGNVLYVGFQIGQRVRKGELLVKIDDSTLRAQLAQAQAHLANLEATYGGGVRSAQANLDSAKVAYETSERTYQRDLQLFQQGFVSKQDLDQARSNAQSAQAAYQAAIVANENASLSSGTSAALADLANARAAVQQIEAQIVQTNVVAPFDGVVTARNVDPGALASPGTPLVQVSQLDPVFVDAGISGNDLQYVRVGTPVTVTVGTIPGRVWHASVAYLNLQSLPGTLTYQARVRVANPDFALRGGMIAAVNIVRSQKSNALLAPRAAVYQTDTGYSMFVAQPSKDQAGHPILVAQSVPVDLGIANDQEAEVSGAGLHPGLEAILNHPVFLQPGMPVQIIPAAGGARQVKATAQRAKSAAKNGAG
jgi:HlyD family secretion protein